VQEVLYLFFVNSFLHHDANSEKFHLTPWRLAGFGDFCEKTVFGCLTNTLAPPPIALESCSTAETDRPV